MFLIVLGLISLILGIVLVMLSPIISHRLTKTMHEKVLLNSYLIGIGLLLFILGTTGFLKKETLKEIKKSVAVCEKLDPTTDMYVESIYELQGVYNELEYSLNEVYKTAQDGSASFAMVSIRKKQNEIVRQIRQKVAVLAPKDIPNSIQAFLDEHRSE